MAARSRVDAELVRRGLARSRRQAAELVAAGRVTIAGRVAAKPSAPVDERSDVVVAPDAGDVEYASRAAWKLAGALDTLAARGTAPHDPADRVEPVAASIPLQDAHCADLGASTGGFTDVLLRRGAAHVVAVDVGHGQLLRRLRDDTRVTVVEGKNVRDLVPADLDRAPDLVTGDLSFISLTLVLPAVAGVLRPGGTALLLVKPQFEVGRERLGKGGVVRDPALHARAVTTVVRAGRATGLRPRGIVPSPLPGPSGNREFFVWFTRDDDGPGEEPARLDDVVRAAVDPERAGRPHLLDEAAEPRHDATDRGTS